jgi:hypothetical protein
LVSELVDTPRTVTVPDPSGSPVDVVIDGYKLANLVGGVEPAARAGSRRCRG